MTNTDKHGDDDRAYFTLVMLGDEFVRPALALGASLVNSGSVVQRRYCMVTSDVSIHGRRQLSRYWQLLDVEYLSGRDLPCLLSQRMRDIYGHWIAHSFTKWRCLEQAVKLNVRRYLYLDADTIVLRNLDRLFAEVTNSGDSVSVAVNFFPVFSTVSYHAERYHPSRLLQRLRAFEASESGGDRLPWRCDVERSELRDAYFDATRADLGGKRHFLLNSSMVYLSLKPTDSDLLFRFIDASVRGAPGERFDAYGQTIDSRLRERMSLVERGSTAVFANGWDEQVFAEALLAFPRRLKLNHLRTVCNVNAGFWNSAKIKLQPWSMTWWGACKPWNDSSNVPKYTDVYLWRYFDEKAATHTQEVAR